MLLATETKVISEVMHWNLTSTCQLGELGLWFLHHFIC